MNAVLVFNDGGNYIMAPIDINSATLSDNGTPLTMGVILLLDAQSDNTCWIEPVLHVMGRDGYLTQVGNSTYSLQLDEPYLFDDSVWGDIGIGLGIVALAAGSIATGGLLDVGVATAAAAGTTAEVAGTGAVASDVINEATSSN